jgi:hypothetical protein
MSDCSDRSDGRDNVLRDFLGCGSPVTGRAGFCEQKILFDDAGQIIFEVRPITLGQPDPQWPKAENQA